MSDLSATIAHPKTPDQGFAARVTMRDATQDDIATLVPLINDAYKARDAWLFGEQLRLDDEALRDELADDRTTAIVAEIDSAIAGFAVVRQLGGYTEFGLLVVGRERQGRGLARMIIERAEAMARDAGFRELRLNCIRENGLPPFYEALGYIVHSEEFASRWNSVEPFTLVEMRKTLR
jgi:GNAT superfamily N-acetyltransferase